MLPLPPITRALIFTNAGVFLAELLLGDALVSLFALWPIGPHFLPWQIVSYAFLHGSLSHIAINMLAVFMFGADLERVWGARRYLGYYLASVLAAALSQLVVAALTGNPEPTIGASGAVFGLLLAFAIYFPQRVIVPLIPPIPMPARVFVTLYGALELYLGVTNSQLGVAHFAHLGGMLGGYLLIRYWRASRIRARWWGGSAGRSPLLKSRKDTTMIARKTKIMSAMALALGIAALPAPAQSNPAANPGQSAKAEAQQDSAGIAATIRQYSLAQRDQAARATKLAMEDIDRRMKSVEQDLDRKFEGMGRSAREESRETLARLHRQRNELSEWYGGIKHSSAAAWEDVKQGFATSYDALAQALSKARKKF